MNEEYLSQEEASEIINGLFEGQDDKGGHVEDEP